MNDGSAMDNGLIDIRGRPARAYSRVRQRAGRNGRCRRLYVVAGFTVVGLLLWLKISLGFGHGGALA
jgi:hypothetical protein